jgi:Fe-S-cluster containining protein
MPQAATVHRPIVRSFTKKFTKEAAAYARSGGHAVLWENDKRARLYFPKPAEGDEADFGLWAIYDMGKFRWDEHHTGTFRGLGSTLIPRDCLWIAKRRAERDSVHPGPTRKVSWDCQSCAACCRDNEVVILPEDVARFKEGGLGHLAKPPYAKRHKDGRVILTLLANKRCRHLARDNRCKVYHHRPHACSEFPMGSECCIFAREDVLDLHDGVPPEKES